ncbi:MAG: cytochrome C [Gemmatimonadaceae bacterium]|nr:cytochrome C [Gemmatimonadaceae bacterium]
MSTFSLRSLALLGAAAVLACSDAAPTGSSLTIPAEEPNLEFRGAAAPAMALVGSKIFVDTDLSLRRNQSCETCHDAAFGFSSPNLNENAHGAVLPGSVPTRFGNRRPPSASYAAFSPVFGYNAEDDVFVGGNFWDGRATGARLGSPIMEQALKPFLDLNEQALPDAACVMWRISRANYAPLYYATFGPALRRIEWPAATPTLCQTEGSTVPLGPRQRQIVMAEFDNVGRALGTFQASERVSPFNSRYDLWLRGKAQLTGLELDGLRLYEGKAQCAACHPNAGKRALFTDFTYDNIGVPANLENPALISRGFVDEGLGAILGRRDLRGAQKVPSLRNTDKRPHPLAAKAFMHNGAFKTLEQVVHFYNTRDVLPRCPVGVDHRDPRFGVTCWPAPEVDENVNVDELGNLGLTPREERAVVAYIRTLNDRN